jgi:hypothetical protein
MAASQPGQVQRFLRMRLKEWQHRDNLACSGRLYAADPGGETRVLRLTPIRSSETNGHFNSLGTIPKNMAVEYDAAKEREVLPMRTILGCAALALAFSTATIPAQAKGCIKGALIGGTAGHFAGHHGLLGAAAGCVIGRHEANRQRQLKRQHQNSQTSTVHYR